MRLTSHYPKEVRPVHAVVRLRLTSSLTEQTFLWNVGALRRPRKIDLVRGMLGGDGLDLVEVIPVGFSMVGNLLIFLLFISEIL